MIATSNQRKTLNVLFLVLLVAFTLLAAAPQSNSQTKPASGSPTPSPTQQPPDAAGGPQGDTGSIAIPKKKPEEDKPVERQERPKNPQGLEDYSLHVDVPLVNLDVGVVTKEGQFIPGLHKENFRVSEDGVPQKITIFQQSERPITAVMLVEFASTNYRFIYDMWQGAYSFIDSLKKNDWVSLISYDMKPQIVVDFTQDKTKLYGGMNTLRIPGFSETNLFDALYDTLDRIDGIEGQKYVILISSGRDTFSKLTYDKILKKVQGTRNITIYAVGTGQAARIMADSYMGPLSRLDYLQADNQMGSFAKMTGGRAFFPRFEAEFPEIFGDIANTIRNQYTIGYHPTNSKQDGTYRKLKVELVDPNNGQPLKVVNEKKKEMKYQVIAREGYKAKQVVE